MLIHIPQILINKSLKISILKCYNDCDSSKTGGIYWALHRKTCCVKKYKRKFHLFSLWWANLSLFILSETLGLLASCQEIKAVLYVP